MANRVAELARSIKIEQAKPWDEAKETDEQHLERLALEDEWIGGICYKGNSASWSHSKSVNYGRELQRAWNELRKLGIEPDGNTSVAQAIAKFCARRTLRQLGRSAMFFQNVYCGKCQQCIGFFSGLDPLPAIFCLDCEAAVMADQTNEPQITNCYVEQK